MARIAVDCDGVLADFNNAALRVIQKLFPGKKFVFDTWDWIAGEQAKRLWAEIKRSSNWWLSLDAYEDQVHDFARFLSETNKHTIWIVTSRVATEGLSVARQTEIWLDLMGLRDMTNNYVGVITVPHPSNKAKLYETLEIDYSVDDKAETVEACDQLERHKAFLLNRQWNQDAKVDNRVDKLGDMFDIIKKEGK